MRKALVILVLYLALGRDGFSSEFRFLSMPARSYSGPMPIYSPYAYGQVYDPMAYVPAGYSIYRGFSAPYRYLGSQYLPQQLTTLPLGWNRYFLTAKMQAPYSLIIRNSPQYSSYRDEQAEESPPRPAGPPVRFYRIPVRGAASSPAAGSDSTVVSRGMTEEQVKAQLGPPMIQVVLGETRSFVYDELLVEFDRGRVKNVAFK